jgi:hypothetical protein
MASAVPHGGPGGTELSSCHGQTCAAVRVPRRSAA